MHFGRSLPTYTESMPKRVKGKRLGVVAAGVLLRRRKRRLPPKHRG